LHPENPAGSRFIIIMIMKKLVFVFFLLQSLDGSTQAKQAFTIQGTIADGTKCIYLSSIVSDPKYNSCNFTDSCKVINNRFRFSGNLSYPHAFRLFSIDSSDGFSIESELFFVQSGKQFISIDSLSEGVQVVVRNSVANNEFLFNYLPKVQPLAAAWEQSFEKIDSVWSLYNGDVPKPILKAMREDEHQKKRDVDSFLLRYVQQNPDSYVALWKLVQRFSILGYISIYSSIYSHFSQTLKNTATGKALGQALQVASITDIGRKFPAMPLLDINNKPISLSSTGKNKQFVFIDVWYSHCAPCIKQFDQLKSIYDRFRKSGFDIISISVDKKSDRQDWLNTISKYGLNWTQFWDVNGKESGKLAINSFPSNFLLDTTGTIILKNIDPFELVQFLDEHLSK
jgi:peroxiredoxin